MEKKVDGFLSFISEGNNKAIQVVTKCTMSREALKGKLKVLEQRFSALSPVMKVKRLRDSELTITLSFSSLTKHAFKRCVKKLRCLLREFRILTHPVICPISPAFQLG